MFLSRVTFDGSDIYVHPSVDHEKYMEWKRRQDEELSVILSREKTMESESAIEEWKKIVPVLYRGATVDSVNEYDTRAAGVMRSLADSIKDKPSIPQHLALTSAIVSITDSQGKIHKRPIKGKTWAGYAYIDQIVRTSGLITDPEREIVCTQESAIIGDLYGFSTRRATLDYLLNGRRIVMVDSCGQMTGYDAKNRADAFTTLIDGVNTAGNVSLILIISSNDWTLQEFKPLVERLQPKARRLIIAGEPDGISDDGVALTDG